VKGEIMMKLKVAFVCTGNSCRSQMAEGWAKQLGSDVLEVYSAGTHPSEGVNRNAIVVMKEAGVDISSQYPKILDEIPFEMDILIKMGCGVVCPFVPNKYEEDWGLEDPVGKPIEEFRETRDIIKAKAQELIEKVRRGEIKR
jgi:arsenate reductase (thioredoxin)